MMFDFDKDLDDESEVDYADLNSTFASLDPKVSHASPRPVQLEAWTALTARLQERDIVLKLSTGAGKTTIALVYLYAMMKSSNRPVVYLCPTRQLVGQVLREANLLGIPAGDYPAGQSHPGTEALQAERIVVCTYNKLFNAKTPFKRSDVNLYPHAMVLDDAHAGIQVVKDAFTLAVPKDADLYAELVALLQPSCKAYDEAGWAFLGRDNSTKMEVPYWLWADLVPAIRELIDGHAKAHMFTWPYLRPHLRWCRCVVSDGGIEIAPGSVPFDSVEPFQDAEHRVFMSATLSDDSALVRELGCSSESAENPLVPSGDAGVGERMVLVPTLLEPSLDRAWVMKWAAKLKHRGSVVVLSASERLARDWEEVGARVELRDDVEDVVAGLRNGSESFVAFTQRYDGMDLPDDACRVLIIDGMPQGQGLIEDVDEADRKRPAGALERWVHRVEQGMGRAVRSNRDYAVVILAGADVAHFVAQADVRDRLGAGTRAQIDLAKALTKKMREATTQGGVSEASAMMRMAEQCLDRESNWKRFYDKKVRQAVKSQVRAPAKDAIRLAAGERAAWESAFSGDSRSAAQSIEAAVGEHLPDQRFEGWFVQQEANFAFDTDRGTSMQRQRAAHRKNTKLFRPPTGVDVPRVTRSELLAPSIIIDWFNGFVEANGAVLEFQLLRGRVGFGAVPDEFEEGLAQLAPLFGARGSRPEKEFGTDAPDNMWRWADVDWVIEAKNRRTMLPKKDAGQLHTSMQWHADNFPERKAIPVVAASVAHPEHDARFPEGTRLLMPTGLTKILARVEGLVAALCGAGPLFTQPDRVARMVVEHELDAEHFLERYTVPLGKRLKK